MNAKSNYTKTDGKMTAKVYLSKDNEYPVVKLTVNGSNPELYRELSKKEFDFTQDALREAENAEFETLDQRGNAANR